MGRMPHTPFRRRSRPLGQAYAPSEVSGILSFEQLEKVRRYSFCAYVKIYTYARPKITTAEPHGGGGGLSGN